MYPYALRYEAIASDARAGVFAYFFMPPNVCFPPLTRSSTTPPFVRASTTIATRSDPRDGREADRSGLVHLILYRFVSPAPGGDSGGAARPPATSCKVPARHLPALTCASPASSVVIAVACCISSASGSPETHHLLLIPWPRASSDSPEAHQHLLKVILAMKLLGLLTPASSGLRRFGGDLAPVAATAHRVLV